MIVIGVSADRMGRDNEETLGAFVAQTGVTFPIGYDESRSYEAFIAGAPGISPYPLDVILDKEGKVAFLRREYDAGAMRTVLDGLTR